MGTLANSEDPDEMQHNAAFHQCLHCLLRYIQSSWIEVYNCLEIITCVTLKCIIDNSILIVPICMGKFIRIQRVIAQIWCLKYSSKWRCHKVENNHIP